MQAISAPATPRVQAPAAAAAGTAKPQNEHAVAPSGPAAGGEYDIVVLGAGSTGAATAMRAKQLLNEHGIDGSVLVVDKHAAPFNPLRGYNIAPVGIDLLKRWGALDDVIDGSKGWPISAINTYNGDFQDAALERTAAQAPLDPRPDRASVSIADVADALQGKDARSWARSSKAPFEDSLLTLAAQEGVEIRRGVEVDGVQFENGGVSLTTKNKDGSSGTIRGRLFVDAEGPSATIAKRDMGIKRQEYDGSIMMAGQIYEKPADDGKVSLRFSEDDGRPDTIKAPLFHRSVALENPRETLVWTGVPGSGSDPRWAALRTPAAERTAEQREMIRHSNRWGANFIGIDADKAKPVGDPIPVEVKQGEAVGKVVGPNGSLVLGDAKQSVFFTSSAGINAGLVDAEHAGNYLVKALEARRSGSDTSSLEREVNRQLLAGKHRLLGVSTSIYERTRPTPDADTELMIGPIPYRFDQARQALRYVADRTDGSITRSYDGSGNFTASAGSWGAKPGDARLLAVLKDPDPIGPERRLKAVSQELDTSLNWVGGYDRHGTHPAQIRSDFRVAQADLQQALSLADDPALRRRIETLMEQVAANEDAVAKHHAMVGDDGFSPEIKKHAEAIRALYASVREGLPAPEEGPAH